MEREGFYTDLTTNLTPRAQITARFLGWMAACKAQETQPGPAAAATSAGNLWNATGHKINVSARRRAQSPAGRRSWDGSSWAIPQHQVCKPPGKKFPPGQGQECLQELRLQRTSVLTALGPREEDPEFSDGCGPAPQHFQLYFSLYKTLG